LAGEDVVGLGVETAGERVSEGRSQDEGVTGGSDGPGGAVEVGGVENLSGVEVGQVEARNEAVAVVLVGELAEEEEFVVGGVACAELDGVKVASFLAAEKDGDLMAVDGESGEGRSRDLR
jgi:hypothetical protein